MYSDNKLFGKTLEELKTLVSANAMPAYTAKQIASWLYKKGVTSIDEMTDLSLKFRETLKENYTIGRHTPIKEQASTDGTKKYLYESSVGRFIESVYIPDKERATLCVSSQVGCRMGCAFCMTARQGFQGHLSACEILNQLQSLPEYNRITNIVYMGMGEPFDNITHVLKSLEILTSDYGYGWSPTRVTVSSIGIIQGLEEFLEKSKCHLAISLHSPFDLERLELMPMQKTYPIASVLDIIRKHNFEGQRRVSFEYIMFKDVNDTPNHARELSRILNGIRCRVNLIRFHAIPDSLLMGSPESAMLAFQKILNEKGLITTIRASRGEDIFAACGMLSTKEQAKLK